MIHTLDLTQIDAPWRNEMSDHLDLPLHFEFDDVIYDHQPIHVIEALNQSDKQIIRLLGNDYASLYENHTRILDAYFNTENMLRYILKFYW